MPPSRKSTASDPAQRADPIERRKHLLQKHLGNDFALVDTSTGLVGPLRGQRVRCLVCQDKETFQYDASLIRRHRETTKHISARTRPSRLGLVVSTRQHAEDDCVMGASGLDEGDEEMQDMSLQDSDGESLVHCGRYAAAPSNVMNEYNDRLIFEEYVPEPSIKELAAKAPLAPIQQTSSTSSTSLESANQTRDASAVSSPGPLDAFRSSSPSPVQTGLIATETMSPGYNMLEGQHANLGTPSSASGPVSSASHHAATQARSNPRPARSAPSMINNSPSNSVKMSNDIKSIAHQMDSMREEIKALREDVKTLTEVINNRELDRPHTVNNPSHELTKAEQTLGTELLYKAFWSNKLIWEPEAIQEEAKRNILKKTNPSTHPNLHAAATAEKHSAAYNALYAHVLKKVYRMRHAWKTHVANCANRGESVDVILYSFKHQTWGKTPSGGAVNLARLAVMRSKLGFDDIEGYSAKDEDFSRSVDKMITPGKPTESLRTIYGFLVDDMVKFPCKDEVLVGQIQAATREYLTRAEEDLIRLESRRQVEERKAMDRAAAEAASAASADEQVDIEGGLMT